MTFTNFLLLSLLAVFSTLATPFNTRQLSKRGTVPYGANIYSCTIPGTVALTFDDGPYQFTEELLNTLSSNNVKATFFLNGANMGNIYDYTSTVKRMAAEGHQIGSHTWSHPYLTQLSKPDIQNQMWQLEGALTSILGYYPTYMRPPFLDTNNLVLQTLGDLGYHVISCSIDTKDYANDTPDLIWNSVATFKQQLAGGGTIELSHDVHANTVHTLAQQMINEVKAKGLKAVTVGECLGDPAANWYRTATNSSH